jgi:8-oxo-dGTP diphosphatase
MHTFDYTARLPMKRMAAGGLFLNADHHLLIVKPIYREGWQVPGGIVNADESPLTACRREVREELGIDVDLGRLLSLYSLVEFYLLIKLGELLSNKKS